jgi:hypothetical protein
MNTATSILKHFHRKFSVLIEKVNSTPGRPDMEISFSNSMLEVSLSKR